MKYRSLHKMVLDLRENPGLLRKKIIGEAVQKLGFDTNFFEDGAIISLSKSLGFATRSNIIFAGDGICPSILKTDSYGAGRVGMLLGVNDIVAMGATPLCAMDFICGDKSTISSISSGLDNGSKLTGVPIVGGHTRFNQTESYLVVAMLGHVNGSPLRSTGAHPGDDIIVAIDTEGIPSDTLDCCWVSYNKTKEELWKRWTGIISLNGMGKLTSGKDISMGGVLGTLTMLCEASKTGASIYLDRIPRPPLLIKSLEWWLMACQTLAFCVTCDPKDSQLVFTILNKTGFSAQTIGHMNEGSEVKVSHNDEKDVFWDWKGNSVFGFDDVKCRAKSCPCSKE